MKRSILTSAGLFVAVVCGLYVVQAAGQAAAQGGVSSATYSMARAGLPHSADAVLVEEFVNYHRHQIPEPMGAALALDVRWGAPAVGPEQREAVLQVGLASTRSRIESNKIPPLNLALVIDQSGSMQGKRIENVKKALLAFLDKLRPSDRVCIVGFSNEAKVVLASHSPPEHKKMRTAVSSIAAEGSTNLHAGLMLGYEQVAAQFDPAKTNRVILLTDGEANVGTTGPEQIIKESVAFNDLDIDLSGIGVGHSFSHGLMKSLTDAGRGLLHFVGDDADIEKTFVEELESLLAPVARRVSMEIQYDDAWEVVHVRGYDPSLEKGRITVPLDDLNHGATQVVLVRFRAPENYDGKELGATARLRYTDVATRQPVVAERSAKIAFDPKLPADASLLTDAMVRKNETIGELAQGVKNMAQVAGKSNDPKLASAELTAPLAVVQQRYPKTDDPDLQRMTDVLTKYQKLLAAEVDRKVAFDRKRAEKLKAEPKLDSFSPPVSP